MGTSSNITICFVSFLASEQQHLADRDIGPVQVTKLVVCRSARRWRPDRRKEQVKIGRKSETLFVHFQEPVI